MKCLSLLLLIEKLLKLGLGKLLLGNLAWSNRLGSSEGWPLSRLLLKCRLLEELLLLLRSKLLLLLGNKLLLRLLLESWLLLLLRKQVGGQGINLTILVIISGESLQSNLLPGQLRQGNLLRLLLGSKLLRPLLSKLLLLGSKLLLLLRSKLLLLGSKLLLRRKLLLLLGSKLLLLLRSKLLRILGKLLILLELLLELTRLLLGKLLWLLLLSKLLLLLKIPEIGVKVLSVELLRGGSARVEVGGIEHRPPGSLLLPVVGEGLPLGAGVVLGGDPLLLLYDGLLEGQHSLVPLLLQLKGRVSLKRNDDDISMMILKVLTC